jgi:hypothetical protein
MCGTVGTTDVLVIPRRHRGQFAPFVYGWDPRRDVALSAKL